jgi:hypothetical protein
MEGVWDMDREVENQAVGLIRSRKAGTGYSRKVAFSR